MGVILVNPYKRFYTVGYFMPNGKWEGHRDFDSKDEAARYIHWLNGGDSHEAFFESKEDQK
jgi:hypothetical protein